MQIQNKIKENANVIICVSGLKLLISLSLVVVIDANWVLQWEFVGQPESSIG